MSRIKLATAATAALLLTAPMAQAEPFHFGGFYAGGHFGYMDVDAGFGSGDGTMGGLQAGYNSVNGTFMWGVEIDFSLTDASPCCDIDVGPFATLRPRIGYAVDNWLLYFTGGIASVQVEDFDAFDGTYGWTLGAGVERMVGDIVGVKLEYRYMRFDDLEQGLSAPPASSSGDDFDMHTVMVGVNFHF
jgi:outer membrane immunogenic protein